MKVWIKILFIGIIILALLFGATYVFMVFKGKAIITKQLESITQKKVSMDYFGLIPPLNIKIKKLNIEGLTKVDSIYISPSILGLLTGNLVLNDIKIIKPEFTYERIPPKITELPNATVSSGTTATPDKKKPLRLIFKRINVTDGKIDFIDRTVSEDGIKITVKDINFNLHNLYALPRSVITNFELKGKIPWQQGAEEGKIEVEGWLNLFKKDMQAKVKVKDIDGIVLYPYYAAWVDLEKARIEKVKLNFISDLSSLNNDLTVHYRLELTDIVFKPRSPEEEEHKAEKIAHAVIDIFKTLNQGKIVLEHTFKTKMDRPEFGFGNIKMAFEDKLATGTKSDKYGVENILILPGKLLETTVKSATDLSKAVINGVAGVGKEFKKAIEGTFKKEKKE